MYPIRNMAWHSNILSLSSGESVLLYYSDEYTLDMVKDWEGNSFSKDSIEWKKAQLYVDSVAREHAKDILLK